MPSPIPLLPYSTPVPTGVPYSTAQTISTNAIAFVAVDLQNDGPSSLWVVNVDGSGEKELVHNLDISRHKPYQAIGGPYGNSALLQWSPNGKWISYMSQDELWLITPDGSIQKNLPNLSNEDSGIIYAYKWSPDSSRIAFLQVSNEKPNLPTTVGIVDVESGNLLSSFNFEFSYTILFSWSPNGQSLLLGNTSSLVLVDPMTGKFIKKFQDGCSNPNADRAIIPPSGQWFALLGHGTGAAGLNFCIKGIDGSSRNNFGIAAVSLPIWDRTGNVLYFSALDYIGGPASNNYNDRLLQYNVKTQEVTQLLTLEKTNYQFVWSVALSPDNRNLVTYSATSANQVMFIFVNLDSLSTVKYVVDLPLPDVQYPNNEIAWSPDNASIVFVSPPLSIFNQLGGFYRLDIHTGKTTIISTKRWIRDWVVSPSLMNH